MSARRAQAFIASFALVLGLGQAHAQDIVIDIEIDDEAAEQYGLDPAALEAELSDAITSDLKLAEQGEFLRQMAHANLMATKGMGADYASNPQRFVFGGSLGTAVNEAGVSFGRGSEGLPTAGFAFQASLLAGVNLGAFSGNDKSAARRFILYVNGLSANTQLEPFKANFVNVGAHLQVKLIGKSSAAGAVEWGGLDLTSGYELSRYKIELRKPLPIEATDVTWDAEGALTVGSSGSSVPIELSSNVRVLIATLFGGVAADVALDSEARSEIALIGPIKANVDPDGRSVGRAEVSMENTGGEVGTTGRVFGGAQVELSVVKLYGHLNVGFDRSVGGHLGLRVAM